MITEGLHYKVTLDLDDMERMAKLTENILRGNHKSATSRPEDLKERVERDVTYGFALPLPAHIVELIDDAMVQPCGLASQFTLTELGERVLKDRLTHDLSFWITQWEASVNKRIDLEQYPELIYGYCLL